MHDYYCTSSFLFIFLERTGGATLNENWPPVAYVILETWRPPLHSKDNTLKWRNVSIILYI